MKCAQEQLAALFICVANLFIDTLGEKYKVWHDGIMFRFFTLDNSIEVYPLRKGEFYGKTEADDLVLDWKSSSCLTQLNLINILIRFWPTSARIAIARRPRFSLEI